MSNDFRGVLCPLSDDLLKERHLGTESLLLTPLLHRVWQGAEDQYHKHQLNRTLKGKQKFNSCLLLYKKICTPLFLRKNISETSLEQ